MHKIRILSLWLTAYAAGVNKPRCRHIFAVDVSVFVYVEIRVKFKIIRPHNDGKCL